ncbi:MAG: ATP-binding protein [candidate division Zixibacteria bacterium]|nr:ATP-binding protein [candidate division Zixibacteria bacterium]
MSDLAVKNNNDVAHDLSEREFDTELGTSTDRIAVGNVLAEMEKALNDIVSDNPRIGGEEEAGTVRLDDLKAVLEISLAINSSLVLEEILQVVMLKAVELLSAERGFVMLLDKEGILQFKSAHNIRQEEITEESFKISNSIANRVAETGKSVYTSDAQEDERYANQKSVVELKLRSIMCVPLKIKNHVIGVIYLDNSSHAKLFLKSDMYLFELFAQQAAMAIHNAQLYGHLSRLKRYNEDIIAQSPVGIIVIDPEYNLVTINDASLATFQINKSDITPGTDTPRCSRLTDLIPPAEWPKWRKMIEQVLTGGGNFREDRYFHNTGYDEKVLSIKVSATTSLPGSKTGAILVIEDITEKVILEKYVILSEKLVAKGEMAASIGHELNNYLTIISNNAELAQINIDRNDMERAKNNSSQVVDNIAKMKRFTDGLMDFSKMETEMVSYDIRHLVENLLFSLKSQRKFKNVTVDFVHANVPDIHIDVGQIQQVLLNLMNNAVDAMEKSAEPHIKIDCRFDTEQDRMIIAVADNGHGMSEEIRQKIFQPHFTTKANGHGLGLANSRKIILNHGGDIQVDSAEGQGTTFTIYLPRKADAHKS